MGTPIDGKKAKALREQHGLTQEELADTTGLTERTIRRAEHGRPISASTRQRLAHTFRTTEAELLPRPVAIAKPASVPARAAMSGMDRLDSAFAAVSSFQAMVTEHEVQFARIATEVSRFYDAAGPALARTAELTHQFVASGALERMREAARMIDRLRI